MRPGDGDEYSLPCQWTVDYHVSLPDTSAATEDQIVFTVNPDGDILSQTTLPRCLASGFTATPGPSPSEIETPAPTTATPEITNAPSPTQAPADDESDDGSDTLLIVAIGYLARRRRTQAPQPSAPDDESGPLGDGCGGPPPLCRPQLAIPSYSHPTLTLVSPRLNLSAGARRYCRW